jgi:peptidoglycan/LPS O-acetylase OafA/YrhL
MGKQNRLLELDCLRGIAAISVVFFHLTMGRAEEAYGFGFGVTGVDLFFMISGFVIFLTLEKTNTYREFLISRFARLFPTYWVCVTITAILTITWKIVVKYPLTFPTVKDYLVNLTMTQYYWGVKDIDGPYWTLIIELFFYVLMLIVFLFKKLHKIELIGFCVIAIAVIYGTVLKTLCYPVYHFLNLYVPFLNYSPLFFSGIIFYRIKFQKLNIIRAVLILCCLAAQITIYYTRGNLHLVVSQLQYGLVLTLYFVVFYLYTANLLSFIVNKVTLFLGKISYSLYLIHQYVSVSLILPLFTHSKFFHFNFWLVVFVMVLPVILFAGYILNKFVEIPSNKYLKQRLSKNI